MSALRGVRLVILAMALVALLFGFVKLGHGDDEETSTRTDAAQTGAAIDAEVEKTLTEAVEFVDSQDAVTIERATEGDTDLQLVYSGSSMSGVLVANGMTVQVIGIGGDKFLKAGADFWNGLIGDDNVAAQLVDKWVLLDTAGAGFAEFAQLMDRESFIPSLLTPSATMKMGDEVTEGNVKAKTIVDEVNGGALTYFFDVEDGRPLQLNADADEFRFDYSPVTAPARPSDAEIINLSSVTGAQ